MKEFFRKIRKYISPFLFGFIIFIGGTYIGSILTFDEGSISDGTTVTISKVKADEIAKKIKDQRAALISASEIIQNQQDKMKELIERIKLDMIKSGCA